MSGNMILLFGCGLALLTMYGCCGCVDGGDYGTGGYGSDYYGSSAESDYYASQAGNYEGSDCWGSAGCTGVDDGTYQYEDYSSGSYDYYEQ